MWFLVLIVKKRTKIDDFLLDESRQQNPVNQSQIASKRSRELASEALKKSTKKNSTEKNLCKMAKH
jgi:hypothetical protein